MHVDGVSGVYTKSERTYFMDDAYWAYKYPMSFIRSFFRRFGFILYVANCCVYALEKINDRCYANLKIQEQFD